MAAKKKAKQEEKQASSSMQLGDLRRMVNFLGPMIQADALISSYSAINFGRTEPESLSVVPFARNGLIQTVMPICVPQELDGVAVDGESFCSFIRSLKQADEEPVEMLIDQIKSESGDEVKRLELRVGKSECFFPFVESAKLQIKQVKKTQKGSSIATWVEALKVCRLTTSKGRGAGIFNGIHVNEKGKLFSTDRFRLSAVDPEVRVKGEFTLPAEAADYLVRQFQGVESDFQYALVDSLLIIFCQEYQISCSLMDGQYPPVEKAVESSLEEEGSELELGEEFKEALEQHSRMQSLISDAMDRESSIEVSDGKLSLLSRTPGSELKTRLDHKGKQKINFLINPEAILGHWSQLWVNQDGSTVRFSDANYIYMVRCK